jgi:hypothetical protein
MCALLKVMYTIPNSNNFPLPFSMSNRDWSEINYTSEKFFDTFSLHAILHSPVQYILFTSPIRHMYTNDFECLRQNFFNRQNTRSLFSPTVTKGCCHCWNIFSLWYILYQRLKIFQQWQQPLVTVGENKLRVFWRLKKFCLRHSKSLVYICLIGEVNKIYWTGECKIACRENVSKNFSDV